MMWPLMADLFLISNMNETIMISNSNTLNTSIYNILIMSMMALTLNHLMLNKSSSIMENKMIILIITVGISVSFSFSTDSPFMFLIMMELTMLPLSYMIIISSKEKDKVEATKFMLMMNTIGSVPFMIFSKYSENMMSIENSSSFMSSNMGMMLFMILFLVKTPMFLTHTWLTKVHVSASGNCSMILASIMIKLGTMGIMKFYKNFGKEKLFYMITSISLMGALYMVMIMFRFFDTKTLIAMSSILHMALLIPMMILKKNIVMISSMMMMTAHGIISYYLFYLITINYEKTENRTTMLMKSMESWNKSFVMIMTMFMFLNMGLPPFMNFISECTFISSTLMMKSLTMTIIMSLILLMSVMFTMQLNSNMIFGFSKMMSKKMNCPMLLMKSTYMFMWISLIISSF